MTTSNANRVLVVEDDPALRELMCAETEDAGYLVTAVASAEEAVTALGNQAVDVVITDLRLPGGDGMQLLHHCRQLVPPPAVIVVTAFGSVPQAVDTIRAGADDFLTKPIDFDHFRLTLARALRVRHLERELDRLQHLVAQRDASAMIGQSRPIMRLREQIRLVARGQAPVLIEGESGVGKELVAAAIHRQSERCDGPFVAVNCASVPDHLLESEFFGHRAGAFTGANDHRKGFFLEAFGGTLMLDEIGEMPLSLQAKLLRVLQEGSVRQIGADRETAIDVRIVACTNKHLADEVSAGQFRADLFYRLETLALEVPPLRDRGQDVELLALYFLRSFAARMDRPTTAIAPEALDRLRAYRFPGNVRELRNAIERAVTFCAGDVIETAHLPARIRAAAESIAPAPGDLPAVFFSDDMLPTMEEVQKRYVRYVLDRVDGNKRRAAAVMGIGRRTLYRWLGDPEDEG